MLARLWAPVQVGRRAGLRVMVAAAVAVAAAACSGDDSTTASPASTSGTAGSSSLRESRDDLSSLTPEAWDSWRLVDPTTIEVTYWGGSEECEGVHVDVVETDQDVTINLSTGSLPGVTECQAIAVHAATRVTLKEELGDREVRQDAES